MEERAAAPAAALSAADAGRAGAATLALLANPLNLRVLRAHADGALRANELAERTGQPAQTTMRAAVRSLRQIGALKQQQVSSLPYGVATELTPAGKEMMFVADVLANWLSTAPHGPIEAGSDDAKTAIKALTAGWSASLVRKLAAHPLTLTELDKQITDLSYPSLERRLSRMRSTLQIERATGGPGRTPFQVTDWLRRAVAPLCVSARWEQRHRARGDATPITPSEIEAAFLLSLPLAKLPPRAHGKCRLAALVDAGELPEDVEALVGVTAEVMDGRVIAALPDQSQPPQTWAVGSADTWLDAIVDGQVSGLRVGGPVPQLAADLVLGTHVALFPEAIP